MLLFLNENTCVLCKIMRMTSCFDNKNIDMLHLTLQKFLMQMVLC